MSIGKTQPLVLLAFAGFVSLAATRICDAMLPALAQDFATSTTEAAAAISSYAIAYGVMQLVYGPLGDRYGKTRVIMMATAWCTISSVLAAAAPSLATLVAARAAMGAGTAAIVPLSIAWIGDTVPLAQRQQALARYAGVTVFGMMLGPLLGGLLAQALSWRAAFMLLVPMFGGITLLLLASNRHQAAAGTAPPPPQREPYLRQAATLLRKRWARAVLVAACIEAGFGIGCLAFVPTVLHARFGLSLLEGGAIAALFGVGGFLFTRAAAMVLRHVHPTRLPGIAGVLMAIAFALLAWMPDWISAAAACTLAGFGFFMMHNTLQVQATQLSPSGTGLAVSLFACGIFIGQSAGITLSALVIAQVGAAWLFAAAGLALLLLGLALQRALRLRAASTPHL